MEVSSIGVGLTREILIGGELIRIQLFSKSYYIKIKRSVKTLSINAKLDTNCQSVQRLILANQQSLPQIVLIFRNCGEFHILWFA